MTERAIIRVTNFPKPPAGFSIADMTPPMESASFASAHSGTTGTVAPMAAPKVMSRRLGRQTPDKQ